MLYITGDTHGTYNILNFRLPQLINYIKNENVDNSHFIIAGDAGIYFFVDDNENRNIDLLQEKLNKNNIKLYFIDGNHDNIPYLRTFKKNKENMFVIRDNIFYLDRGYIYNIDNTNILSLGGAISLDKSIRTEGLNWWKEELLTHEEIERTIENINSNSDIDIILTHNGPRSIIKKMFNYSVSNLDPTEKDLEIVKERIEKYNKKEILWIFGHHHQYRLIREDFIRFICLDQEIIKFEK